MKLAFNYLFSLDWRLGLAMLSRVWPALFVFIGSGEKGHLKYLH